MRRGWALVHLKDVDMTLAPAALDHETTLLEATRAGLFQALGRGGVDIDGVVKALEARGYAGWYVLEQDTAIDRGGSRLGRPRLRREGRASITCKAWRPAESAGREWGAGHATGGTDRPVRTGVIGTGRIGRMHAELLATSVPGAGLAAVSDAVMPLAEEVGQALGVPVLETPSLIGHPEIDAVAICAPTDTHVPLLMAAAEAGKAVFCEKPISLDLAEVDRAWR